VTDRSLIGQLLGWQVLITATACLLLVAGTVVASALILRAQQDSDLSELSQTMCAGIWHELAEPYPVRDLATAGQHFFGESSINGFELELWNRNGELLAHIGDYPELAAPRSQVRLPSSCSSLTATSPAVVRRRSFHARSDPKRAVRSRDPARDADLAGGIADRGSRRSVDRAAGDPTLAPAAGRVDALDRRDRTGQADGVGRQSSIP